VEALLAHSPRTLIHGDFRLDNLLFGTRDAQPACWVIDWEDIMLGNGMVDVAWFLGGCLPAEESDGEQELLRGYRRALIQAGVEGYSWAKCFLDYRNAMISSFVQGILMVVSLETGEDYARNLAGVLSERFMLACRRLRLADLLNYQKSP
jgi:aminoglycoside phosphotransferase (APT) family kinase protein